MVNTSKKEYLAKIKDRYRHAGKKGKTHILDEFCEVCGHHRKHAIRILNSDGRTRKKKPGRPSKYDSTVITVIENIWLNADRPCSLRLISMIPLWLPYYENQYGNLDNIVKKKVLTIKARTLDRVLRNVRKRYGSRGLSGTKPGTYLKDKIPIKINHSNVSEPGFIQADTVAHCGGSLAGSFVWTLTFTDVYTGWTENGAVWNKGQYGIHQLLNSIEERLPFDIKGFHTDNGGEFINHHLHTYHVEREVPICVTRGRAGKSNDNPHVEQKNWTHVRLLLGYQRIEYKSLIKDINELYEAANLLNNFFCSNLKLVFKERRGSKYYKRYDKPTTPCERLLVSPQLTLCQKNHLKGLKSTMNPYKLKRFIDTKRQKIFSELR